MSLNYPTPWKRNGNFVRGPRAVAWLWEDRHRGLSHLNFPVLEKSLGLILLCLPEQFLALSILLSPQVGAHSTGGLLGRSFLKRPGHGFVLLSFFQSFYSCSCYSYLVQLLFILYFLQGVRERSYGNFGLRYLPVTQ